MPLKVLKMIWYLKVLKSLKCLTFIVGFLEIFGNLGSLLSTAVTTAAHFVSWKFDSFLTVSNGNYTCTMILWYLDNITT